MMTLKSRSDTQFHTYDSIPLSQSDDKWFKGKFISSPRSPLQLGMDSYQQEITTSVEIHSQAPILKATAQVQAPLHHNRPVEEVDDVLGRVILCQVNQTALIIPHIFCSLLSFQIHSIPPPV